MILLRKSPGAHQDNALQVHQVSGFEECDDLLIAVARYKASIDTAAVASVSKISLGGTEYSFEAAIALGTEAGAMKLKDAIRVILNTLGYDNRDFVVKQTGTTLTVDTAFSQISFDYLEAAANAFQVKAARSYGDFKGGGDASETMVGADIVGSKVIVSVGATIGVASIAVTSADITDFDGPAAEGKVTTPHSLSAGASTSLAVVVTYADATTATFTVPATYYA